jgi:ADP-ribose pyrophosphatase YjhB (NUDIX family)
VAGHFCIKCGAPLVTRLLEGRDVEACPNDDFVLWRDPKVAAAVIVELDGGIVLGRRAIDPGYGLWCLPGGFVNHDEEPEDAAVRECREEIGVRVELTQLLGLYHVAKTTAASIIGIAFRGRVAGGEKIEPGPEMLELRVFRPDELPPVAFPSHQEVLERYVAAAVRTASPPSTRPAPSRRSRRR